MADMQPCDFDRQRHFIKILARKEMSDLVMTRKSSVGQEIKSQKNELGLFDNDMNVPIEECLHEPTDGAAAGKNQEKRCLGPHRFEKKKKITERRTTVEIVNIPKSDCLQQATGHRDTILDMVTCEVEGERSGVGNVAGLMGMHLLGLCMVGTGLSE
ncbi:hypothetical protein CAPTEDRAFT_186178 [Capitella teleta]|uniref:Uncharacterized protein n=1 Tax=Capitella teleta TaxID=283909 RepID=R7UCA3_CAPTE|nr:hypothetical protein CAPTEDRAFT_186178 [Capitella teleta]|eukprot:ELU03624.1 hypothetical protein CAPTEDRAFT_186178 [Capitella teleta]